MYNDLIELATTQREIQMKSLQVTVKNVYGNELIYPVCEHAKLLCSLVNAKTFTDHSIHLVKQMGYTFEMVLASGRSI